MYPIFRRQSTRYQHSLPTLATNARWHSPPRPEALGSGPQKLHANDAAGRGLWFFVIRRCRNCQTGGRTGLSDMITFFRSNSTKHRIPLVEKRGRLYRNLKDYGTLDEIYRRLHDAALAWDFPAEDLDTPHRRPVWPKPSGNASVVLPAARVTTLAARPCQGSQLSRRMAQSATCL